MKFSEWLEADTLAILCTAIYYGVPSQGYKECYKDMIAWGPHPRYEQMKESAPLEGMRCIGCGELLLQEQKGDG